MNRLLLSFLLLLFAIAPVCAQTTAQAATLVPCPAPSAALPIWSKLVVSGNVVTCYYGKGLLAPIIWTQLGQPQTINFINNPVLVGMYVTSQNNGGSPTLSTGTVDNFSITPAPKYRLTDCDIGAPKLMGSANLIGGVWNLAGSGNAIGGTSDQFNFQPWLVWGDCTVICRITSLSAGNMWQKIGIMVRDGFNTGSDFAMFCATNGGGVTFQYRHDFQNNPDQTLLIAPPAPGIVSSVITGYGLTGTASYILRP